MLIKLAGDDIADVRRGVARNPKTPQEILLQLASDDVIYVLWEVARNPNAPEDILIRLADDNIADVRQGVARNPNASGEVLLRLFDPDNKNFLHRVVDHSNCTIEVLTIAAGRSKSKDVLRAISYSSRLTNNNMNLVRLLYAKDRKLKNSDIERVLTSRNLKVDQ